MSRNSLHCQPGPTVASITIAPTGPSRCRITQHHRGVARGRHQVVALLVNAAIPAVIQPKFFEPLIQVLQHFEAPALHPNEHVRNAGLDRHRSVLELRMFVQHLEALRSILIRKRLAGAFQRLASAIRREMRRRAAIEPVIGHLKEDHRMRRNYLTGRDGDRINAVLAAAGYNFSLLLRWFEELLPALSLILWHALLAASLHLTRCRKTFFTADYLEPPS